MWTDIEYGYIFFFSLPFLIGAIVLFLYYQGCTSSSKTDTVDDKNLEMDEFSDSEDDIDGDLDKYYVEGGNIFIKAEKPKRESETRKTHHRPAEAGLKLYKLTNRHG